LTGDGGLDVGDRLTKDLAEPMTLAEETQVSDADDLVEDDVDDLLIEEVSIDGMCGVY